MCVYVCVCVCVCIYLYELFHGDAGLDKHLPAPVLQLPHTKDSVQFV